MSEAYKGKRGNDYGSPAEQREWLNRPTQQRGRANFLRQFSNLDGPKGASEAYRDGWERIFGSKR